MEKTRPAHPPSRIWYSNIHDNNYVFIKRSTGIPGTLYEIKRRANSLEKAVSFYEAS